MTTEKDSIYATPRGDLGDFVFDEQVVNVFPDMIQRSVPGYSHVVTMLGLFAARYGQPDSRCYDLGCSLGASTLALRQGLKQPGCRIVAVDNSAAMVERCREVIAADGEGAPVELIREDIRDVSLERASVVVLNFTLQFIEPADRLALLQRIYAGMLPGGVLVLSEKVVFEEEERQQLLTDLHHDFKRANGYSELEISQKRTALENVLRPDTVAEHQERLSQAGFRRADQWFQSFNFVSILAQK